MPSRMPTLNTTAVGLQLLQCSEVYLLRCIVCCNRIQKKSLIVVMQRLPMEKQEIAISPEKNCYIKPLLNLFSINRVLRIQKCIDTHEYVRLVATDAMSHTREYVLPVAVVSFPRTKYTRA